MRLWDKPHQSINTRGPRTRVIHFLLSISTPITPLTDLLDAALDVFDIDANLVANLALSQQAEALINEIPEAMGLLWSAMGFDAHHELVDAMFQVI